MNTQSCKPNVRPMVTDFPFENCTTQKVDYVRWPVAAPYKHAADPYLPPEGCMSGDTNYRSD